MKHKARYFDSGLKLRDFKHGDRVIYIPTHADGDVTHSACENGCVSSVTERSIFVKYDCLLGEALTGNEPWTSKSTNPRDMVKR